MNILGAEALFAPLPPVNWLCQTLRLASGAPTLFAGYGYSGKSIALQSLALSVAGGVPLWGKWVVRSGRVLHLDYEQGRRITSERYQRMARAELVEPETLHSTLEVGVLPSVVLTRDILCRAGEGRALVLVDSWRAAHGAVEENDSGGVRASLDAMGVASEKTGATFIVLHHARKPQKDSSGGSKMSVRGSSGFFDGCQTVYLFDGEKVGLPSVSLEKDRIGGQGLDPFSLCIRDTDGGAGLEVRVQDIESKGEQPAESYAKVRALVLEIVRRRPGTSGNEICELTGKKRSSVLASIQSLIAEGELVQVGAGSHTRLYIKGHFNGVSPF